MNVPASLQGLPHLASRDWAQRLRKRLPSLAPKFANAVLIVVVAWQAARFTWALLPQQQQAISIPPTATATMPTRSNNVQQIADAHLFGVATAEEPSAADLANAPQTSMSLVLSGTIASEDPEKGFAFIGESAAAAKFIKVGELVGGGAKLHSVFVDKVILDRGGRLESLNMPRNNLGANMSAPPPVAALPGTTPTQFAQDLRHLAESNPTALTEIIRPQPVFSGGTQRGFRVYPGRNRQQFASLGLQPGDLVTAINGASLDDPARAGEIFNTLSNSDRVTVSIERNGQSQQLTLNTAQIQLPQPADTAGENPSPENAPPPGPGMPQAQ